MTVIEHITELRSRLIRMILAVAVGAVACWVLYPQILDFLVDPYCDIVEQDAVDTEAERRGVLEGCDLLVLDPLEPFSVRLTVAGYGGLALAMPVLLWQIWRFVQPGLYRHERRHASLFALTGVLLFASGAALAYWSVPRALDFLGRIGGENLVSAFSPARYLSFMVKMMLAFGIGFEFPILLIFLQLAGLVTYRQLGRWRQYALVGIVILVAVLTPSGDPFTLMVLSVPMYAFYEAAILFGWLRTRRRRSEPAEETLDEPDAHPAG